MDTNQRGPEFLSVKTCRSRNLWKDGKLKKLKLMLDAGQKDLENNKLLVGETSTENSAESTPHALGICLNDLLICYADSWSLPNRRSEVGVQI